MSSQVEQTRQALLELGLEDWIPIPEAMDTPEVRAAIGPDDPAQAVQRALLTLVRDGLVHLYRGRWDADPEPVSATEAHLLLGEPHWYAFHPDDPTEERLYFVNVENIRER